MLEQNTVVLKSGTFPTLFTGLGSTEKWGWPPPQDS